VAEEVRRLAIQAGTATSEISKIIKEIQSGIGITKIVFE
jgi:methyl-accepting chemotaxis protein